MATGGSSRRESSSGYESNAQEMVLRIEAWPSEVKEVFRFVSSDGKVWVCPASDGPTLRHSVPLA